MMVVACAGATTVARPAAGRSAADGRSVFALEAAGLRVPAMLDIRVTVPAAVEEAQALGDMEFIRRMRSLVQWAEQGRPITQTGAMRRADTLTWMRHLNLRAPGESCPSSMWEIRGIG